MLSKLGQVGERNVIGDFQEWERGAALVYKHQSFALLSSIALPKARSKGGQGDLSVYVRGRMRISMCTGVISFLMLIYE